MQAAIHGTTWSNENEEVMLIHAFVYRIRNKAKLRPVDLTDPRNAELRSLLQKAEFTMLAGDDIVEEDDDEGDAGSASDSD